MPSSLPESTAYARRSRPQSLDTTVDTRCFFGKPRDFPRFQWRPRRDLHPAEIEKNLEFLGMEWAVSLLFGRPRLNTAAGNRRPAVPLVSNWQQGAKRNYRDNRKPDNPIEGEHDCAWTIPGDDSELLTRGGIYA